MELLLALPGVGLLVGYVIPFLLLLTLVVFVHELGHYLVARHCGVRAEVFSIGFGGEIFGYTDRQGTRWRFSWIPLGGYVRFAGDADAASVLPGEDAPPAGSFRGASLGDKAKIVAAGPLMNFLYTIVVLFFLALFGGIPGDQALVGPVQKDGIAHSLGLQRGDRIERVNGQPVGTYRAAVDAIDAREGRPVQIDVRRETRLLQLAGFFTRAPRIAAVQSGSAADRAGFAPGDLIRSIDGTPVASFRELQERVRASGGRGLVFEVERAGRMLRLEATPVLQTRVGGDGTPAQVPVLGVGRTQDMVFRPGREPAGLGEAAAFAVGRTAMVLGLSLVYVGEMITGQSGTEDLGGPIAIAEFSGLAAQRGVWDFLFIMAMISASIGLINLFPIPVLDGGHLVLFAIERVRGKPLGERALRIATGFGLTLVLLLIAFVTYNDIARL